MNELVETTVRSLDFINYDIRRRHYGSEVTFKCLVFSVIHPPIKYLKESLFLPNLDHANLYLKNLGIQYPL